MTTNTRQRLLVNPTHTKRKKVAFVLPLIGGDMYMVYEHIRKVLEKEFPDVLFTATPSGGMGSTLLHSVIDSIVQKDYDLFFVFSLAAALIAKDRIKKYNKNIPFLFTGIAEPEKYGIVQGLEHPIENATGVIHTEQDLEAYCQFFLDCLPDIKAVVLPRQTDSFRSVKKLIPLEVLKTVPTILDYPERVAELLELKGVNVQIISNINEMQLFKELKTALKRVEAVLLLEATRLTAWSENIQLLCDRSDVVLYSGSVNSIKNGHGMLGYGLDYQVIAEKLAQKAILILKSEALASEISVEKLDSARFACINTKVLKQRKLYISEDVLRAWKVKRF